MHIWEKIREEMRKKHLVQREVAAATGLNQSQISRICSGKIIRESEGVKKICAYLKLDVQPFVANVSKDRDRQAAISLLEEISRGSSGRWRQMLNVLRLMKEISGTDV